jgi:hypothetical protein
MAVGTIVMTVTNRDTFLQDAQAKLAVELSLSMSVGLGLEFV